MRRSSLEVGQFALLATQHNIVMSDKELLQVLLAACVEPIHEPATSQGVVDATRQKMVLQQLEAKLVEMLEAKGVVDQVAYDAFAKTYNRPPIPNFKPWVVRYVTADTSRFIGVVSRLATSWIWVRTLSHTRRCMHWEKWHTGSTTQLFITLGCGNRHTTHHCWLSWTILPSNLMDSCISR
jgi:hypothetical protein